MTPAERGSPMEVARTPRCPKCTMTFRIESRKGLGMTCPDCGLVFRERNTGAGGNAILSVDTLTARKVWGLA
jgi:uncharacterized C2H2 Zn-finger protein